VPERTSIARARHVIDVVVGRSTMPVEIGFESEDIGATQGTTLTVLGVVVAQYQPGTRHWDRALETAVDLVRDAADVFPTGASVRRTEAWRDAIAHVLAAYGCTPWDGTVPDWETL
jgi:hypothetical protein